MKTPRSARRAREKRGSILLIVLVTMSALSMFALAATDNTRSMIEISAAERLKARAEAAADSAVAFADKQLALNENWGGVGWVGLDDGSRFRVVRQVAPDPQSRDYIIEAENNDAVVRLYAKFTVDRYDAPILEHAMATLGGNMSMMNVDITGDLLVVDTEAGVKDFDSLSGEWETRESGGDPATWSNNNTVDGDLMTYTGSLDGTTATGDTVQMFEPIINPTWDLDSWLTPGPDRIITTQTAYNQFDTDKTLVIVAMPGEEIRFNQCNVKGGVVIWAPSDWPQRGPSRNAVRWGASNFGLPSSDPASTNIGFVAPATDVVRGVNDTYGHGLFYFHRVQDMTWTHIDGSLWVTNEVDRMTNCSLTYDPVLASVGYEGMGASAIYTYLESVIPYHDPPKAFQVQ